jgi:hypothetical protein
VIFCNQAYIYGELLAPRPIPKLEDNPLLALRDCLFNIFAASLHIWRPSPSATWKRVMTWWLGTHLTLLCEEHITKNIFQKKKGVFACVLTNLFHSSLRQQNI